MGKVVFSFSFKSAGEFSIYKDIKKLNKATFPLFAPPKGLIESTKEEYLKAGFDLEAETEVGLSLSASSDLFEDFFKVTVKKERLRYIRNFEYYTHVVDSEIISPIKKKYIEKISLPKEIFVLDSKFETEMPDLDYYHYKLPKDVAEVAGIDGFVKDGMKGQGINVVMVDSGLYNHAYYKKNDISFQVLPSVHSLDITRDERGHGTGMSGVLLSVSPEVNYTMIKTADAFISYPLTGFQKAIMQNPDIINCSWGVIGYEPQLHLEISNAIDKGIVIVFSAGNGSDDKKNGIFQTIAHPDVVSVGGCFPNPVGKLEASDLASSYYSDIYPERFAPDISGICGHLPFGQLILMPCEPGAIFDKNNGKRDGTSQDDGWFVSSGTSSAAAYVSGLIALLLQKFPQTDRKNIKDSLKHCCMPVLKGKSFMGYEADSTGWNKATGYGFLTGDGIIEYFSKL